MHEWPLKNITEIMKNMNSNHHEHKKSQKKPTTSFMRNHKIRLLSQDDLHSTVVAKHAYTEYEQEYRKNALRWMSYRCCPEKPIKILCHYFLDIQVK